MQQLSKQLPTPLKKGGWLGRARGDLNGKQEVCAHTAAAKKSPVICSIAPQRRNGMPPHIKGGREDSWYGRGSNPALFTYSIAGTLLSASCQWRSGCL